MYGFERDTVQQHKRKGVFSAPVPHSFSTDPWRSPFPVATAQPLASRLIPLPPLPLSFNTSPILCLHLRNIWLLDCVFSPRGHCGGPSLPHDTAAPAASSAS